MIIKNKLLLIALLAGTMALPTAAQAIGFSIQIGDRPYYTHGPRYWNGDYEYIWVPGHRRGRKWIHGHYRRGEHRRHHGRRHHDVRFEGGRSGRR